MQRQRAPRSLSQDRRCKRRRHRHLGRGCAPVSQLPRGGEAIHGSVLAGATAEGAGGVRHGPARLQCARDSGPLNQLLLHQCRFPHGPGWPARGRLGLRRGARPAWPVVRRPIRPHRVHCEAPQGHLAGLHQRHRAHGLLLEAGLPPRDADRPRQLAVGREAVLRAPERQQVRGGGGLARVVQGPSGELHARRSTPRPLNGRSGLHGGLELESPPRPPAAPPRDLRPPPSQSEASRLLWPGPPRAGLLGGGARDPRAGLFDSLETHEPDSLRVVRNIRSHCCSAGPRSLVP
mmetsp:Transcript_115512/g.331555  ORF Transcript_115512/g.331555 Transcript_115512/m.331555 type:complete len:291 (+) Transcript_115512:369-1241(+)